MHRIRHKNTVDKLKERCRKLRRQAELLGHHQRVLRLEALLLSSWVESLALLQLRMAVGQQAEREASAEHVNHFRHLVAEEVSLLQQLPLGQTAFCGADAHRARSSGADAGADAGADTVDDTIAPQHDPMAYFKHLLQLQRPDTAQLTARDLAQSLRDTTLKVNLLLAALRTASDKGGTQRQHVMQQIQESMDRHTVLVLSCIMAGRVDLVEAVVLYNLETLQPDADPERQAAATTALVPQLGLSEQQQQLIAAGTRLYARQRAGIREEIEQLVRGGGVDAPEGVVTGAPGPGGGGSHDATGPSSAASSGSGSGTPASSGSSSGSGGQPSSNHCGLESLEGRHGRLEPQQQRAARLQLLLQKEYHVLVLGVSLFVGALTWEQLAQTCVLAWPFVQRHSVLFGTVLHMCEARAGRPS